MTLPVSLSKFDCVDGGSCPGAADAEPAFLSIAVSKLVNWYAELRIPIPDPVHAMRFSCDSPAAHSRLLTRCAQPRSGSRGSGADDCARRVPEARRRTVPRP